MALATLAEVKAILGIASQSAVADAQMEALLPAAESMILAYLDRQIEAADYTEYVNGTGIQTLLVRQYPIISIASIHMDRKREWGADTLVDPDTYYFAPGGAYGQITRLSSGFWHDRWVQYQTDLTPQEVPGQGNIKIVYRAGYETVPPVIVAAVAFLVRTMVSASAQGAMMNSEGHDGYNYSLGPTSSGNAWSLDPTVANMLKPYRRLGLA